MADAPTTPSQPTPPAPEQVRALAEALKAAVDRHLDAVERRAGESDPVVQEAYSALHEAAEAYDNALFDAYEEVTPFQFVVLDEGEGDEDEGDEAEGDEAEDADEADDDETVEEPSRLALLVRRDYDVVDRAALLAAGREAYGEIWPEGAPDEATADVDRPERAVYQLLHAYGVDGLDGRAEEAGLEPTGGTLWVVDLDEDDETLDEAPFTGVDADRLVYRLDEVYED